MPFVSYLLNGVEVDNSAMVMPCLVINKTDLDHVLNLARNVVDESQYNIITCRLQDGQIGIYYENIYADKVSHINSYEALQKLIEKFQPDCKRRIDLPPLKMVKQQCHAAEKIAEKFHEIAISLNAIMQQQEAGKHVSRSEIEIILVSLNSIHSETLDAAYAPAVLPHVDKLITYAERCLRDYTHEDPRPNTLQELMQHAIPADAKHLGHLLKMNDFWFQTLNVGGNRIKLYGTQDRIFDFNYKKMQAFKRYFIRVVDSDGKKQLLELDPSTELSHQLNKHFGQLKHYIPRHNSKVLKKISPEKFPGVYADDDNIQQDYDQIHRRILQEVEAILQANQKEPVILLFLGFGEGHEVDVIKKSLVKNNCSYDIFGIEFNDDNVKQASKRHQDDKHVHLYGGDATQLASHPELDYLAQHSNEKLLRITIASGFLTFLVNTSQLEALLIVQQQFAIHPGHLILSGRTQPMVTSTLAHLVGMEFERHVYKSHQDHSRILLHLTPRDMPHILDKLKIETKNNETVVDLRGKVRVGEIMHAFSDKFTATPPPTQPTHFDLSLAYLADIDIKELKHDLEKCGKPILIVSGLEQGYGDFISKATSAGIPFVIKPLSIEKANNLLRVPLHLNTEATTRIKLFQERSTSIDKKSNKDKTNDSIKSPR